MPSDKGRGEKQSYTVLLVFERNYKRKCSVNKKYFARIQQRISFKIEEQKSRNDRFFKAVEFIRQLFDPQRSYPFAQFLNKQDLNEIKAQAKKYLIENNINEIQKERRRSSMIASLNFTSNSRLFRRLSVNQFAATQNELNKLNKENTLQNSMINALKRNSVIQQMRKGSIYTQSNLKLIERIEQESSSNSGNDSSNSSIEINATKSIRNHDSLAPSKSHALAKITVD